ncbi:class I SAM-dependent methyltransferase [Solwaraspora sp. WMMD406]|uniref:class I SAM-dependent methyltransferase n=1 Tax=Solwaraspora sp. WMMD406 TaxID=3016095 RepID=UPI0024179CBA|nr:class I SAM-dependent methyltransferase [Solwaraspora sp. WMMD406]MDG4763435.1 class I SAM-dependent methyltransferase [Solwaraspora sp. WMMD406]
MTDLKTDPADLAGLATDPADLGTDTFTTADARRLLDLWDTQQNAYVAYRENRFQVMLDVLRLHFGDGPITVLDLACGPGAISDRVLTALPDARCVAVDYDPILLRIATAALATHGDRAGVHDLDLVSDDWASRLGVDHVDAVLSSTALHWFSPAQLLAVYTAAAGLLRPGGILLNADHLRFGPDAPTRQAVARRHDERTQRDGFAAGALRYDAWYAEAARTSALADLVAERQRRFADRPQQPDSPLEYHLAALRTAGFAEVGTVWQYLDDYVVFARR